MCEEWYINLPRFSLPWCPRFGIVSTIPSPTAKRMFEKSWQIKTHGTRTRVRPSCLEAGMGKHSR